MHPKTLQILDRLYTTRKNKKLVVVEELPEIAREDTTWYYFFVAVFYHYIRTISISNDTRDKIKEYYYGCMMQKELK